MSTLAEAREKAQRRSKDGCVCHVSVTLRKDDGEYAVDPAGYFTSDWLDGCTVESHVSGRLIWER